MKAAFKMNNAVVMFLDYTDKVNSLVEKVAVLKNMHTTVFPLMNPAKNIILSNLLPFISNDIDKRVVTSWSYCVSNGNAHLWVQICEVKACCLILKTGVYDSKQ